MENTHPYLLRCDSYSLLTIGEIPLWENSLEVGVYVYPVNQGIYGSVYRAIVHNHPKLEILQMFTNIERVRSRVIEQLHFQQPTDEFPIVLSKRSKMQVHRVRAHWHKAQNQTKLH